MSSLCESLRIPCKENGHGSDVPVMLAEGGIDLVARYCEEDCAATMMVFACMQALRSNDPAYGATLLCDFANWVIDADLEHLSSFGVLSGHEILERSRLVHRLEEGLWGLDHRLRLERAGPLTASICIPGWEDYAG